jgi:hypothetical protein
MSPVRQQKGLAAAALVVLIVLGVLALVLGRGYFDKGASLGQRAATDASLKTTADALTAFAVLNRRLPCPANGSLTKDHPDNGVEAVASPTTCTHEDGVVPWATLGIRRQDTADAWGGKLSYRVYAPAYAGDGFTRTGGVDATNCNTESAVGGPTEVVFNCGGGSHDDHPVHFFRASADALKKRGLVLNDKGATVEGLAFILISHGASGRGAFQSETGARAEAPKSTAEIRNTQGILPTPAARVWDSPFAVNLHSPAGTSPDDTAHFDDIMLGVAAADLVAKARLGARPWPVSGITQAILTSLVPSPAPNVTYDLGQTTLTMGRVTITASSTAPGTQNVALRVRDGTAGLGVVGAGGSSGASISSTNSESLSIRAGEGSLFEKVDFAFNEFQTRTFSPFARERVEISLWRTVAGVASLVQASTIDSWHDDPRPSRCLFEAIPGSIFDRVDIRPLPRSDSGSSSLTIAAVVACSGAVASCTTSVTNASDCPARPPSSIAPSAVTVGQTSAQLQGIVDPNGTAVTVTFDFGTSAAYGSSIAATPGSLAAGAGVSTVSASLASLACGTTYHFRARATGAGGTTTSNDSAFVTAACS